MRTFGCWVGILCLCLLSVRALGAEKVPVFAHAEKQLESPAMKLLMTVETPFSRDLKELSAIVIEPPAVEENWKKEGLVKELIPSLFGKRDRKLPKHFFVNLLNPFARKEYGYVDPLKPYRGLRPGRRGAFDVKTADMAGIPLIGGQF